MIAYRHYVVGLPLQLSGENMSTSLVVTISHVVELVLKSVGSNGYSRSMIVTSLFPPPPPPPPHGRV